MNQNYFRAGKVLIAPSAYKGSLSALEIASAIESGLTIKLKPEQIKSVPLADGGDGTLTAIHAAKGGVFRYLTVRGALKDPVKAYWLDTEDFAVLELASCCGLATLQGCLQPLYAHTYGLGELMADCLLTGKRKLMIGLGGSASTDGGTGALSALGVNFIDENNKRIELGGGWLPQLSTIDISKLNKRVLDSEINLLTDVRAPLLGPQGAANIFAPQKGANEEEIKILESGLKNLAAKITELTHKDLTNIPGSGAAGGTAFGLASLINAHIKPGFATVSQLIGLKNEIHKADLVITAEGALDKQSFQGKATGELAKLCKKMAKPLIVLPAVCDMQLDWQRLGIAAVYTTAIAGGKADAETIRQAAQTLLLSVKE